MKVIASRGVLVEALAAANSVAMVRTPKPILQCVQLVAEGGTLTVRATDLEVDVRETVTQVQVEKEGRVAAPADKLFDVVREMVGDTVALEMGADGLTLHVRGSDDHFKLFTQKVADFPPLAEVGEKRQTVKFTGKTLKQLIRQTEFAAAKETQRYAINGVLLVADKSSLTLVATDGRRLAKSVGDLAEPVGKDGAKAVIPSKLVKMLAKFTPADDAVVTGEVGENLAVFEFDNTRLAGNLVEGQFPPYEDVIPKDTDKRVTSEVGAFTSAMKRAGLLTTEESKGVRLAFSKKGVVISSRSPESGEATVNLPVKYEGNDLEIGFNPGFFMDGLRAIEGDEVVVEFTAPNRPGKMMAGRFTYIIMPVNLQ